MSYDKTNVAAPVDRSRAFARWTTLSVQKLFQFAEWLLVIVAFQYVGARFGSIAVNIVWLVLSAALTAYVVITIGSVASRLVSNGRARLGWFIVIYVALLLLMTAFLYFVFNLVVDQVVMGQR